MKIKVFTFNPFYENTYILYDDSHECVIIDPGTSTPREEQRLAQYITENALTPVHLLNTHCHIDHILGNRFVSDKYNLPLQAHRLEHPNIENADSYAEHFGVNPPNSPLPQVSLEEGDVIRFGHTKLDVLFAPGHSAGHIVFYHAPERVLIGGDVLFREGIGRTDLPGGDTATLLKSIREKLFILDNGVIVYPGHGLSTSIGHEKQHNPFLNDQLN